MSSDDALRAAIGAGVDPAGRPWSELTPERLHAERSSVKWRRYDADVLPMFVAEMDFAIATPVKDALVRAVQLW